MTTNEDRGGAQERALLGIRLAGALSDLEAAKEFAAKLDGITGADESEGRPEAWRGIDAACKAILLLAEEQGVHLVARTEWVQR